MTASRRDFTALLPPDLENWSQKNLHVMEHIHKALDEAEAPLTDIQLWNLIARTYSPDWTEARAKLQIAEQRITIHKSHENRPLGSIGMALESDTVNEETNNHSLALALFTILDEELRENPDLKRLHTVLVENQRMLEESIKISRGIADVTALFTQVAAAPDKITVKYASPLRKAFGATKNILKRISSKKIRNAPAPSSQGT